MLYHQDLHGFCVGLNIVSSRSRDYGASLGVMHTLHRSVWVCMQRRHKSFSREAMHVRRTSEPLFGPEDCHISGSVCFISVVSL